MRSGKLAAVVSAVVAVTAGCAVTNGTESRDPASELPVLVRFVHGQGGEDLLRVSSDGVVTGWLGGFDGDRPVGCLVDVEFVGDLTRAAAEDLEPGADEPSRDGADFERLEVTGRGGRAWLGDGHAPPVVRLAQRLLLDVHGPETDRTVCRQTPQTSPGDLASGVVVHRWSGPVAYDDRLFVSATGAVVGRTKGGLLSCQVPRSTVQTLTRAVIPDVVPAIGPTIPMMTLRRAGTTHPLDAREGGNPLTTTALALVDDVQLSPEQRTLCTVRR